MKNQQIHQQELKILELEKIVGFKFLLLLAAASSTFSTFLFLFDILMLCYSSCVFEQAEKNVHLEERVQILQQQNEDLKARIDKNLAVSRSVCPVHHIQHSTRTVAAFNSVSRVARSSGNCRRKTPTCRCTWRRRATRRSV